MLSEIAVPKKERYMQMLHLEVQARRVTHRQHATTSRPYNRKMDSQMPGRLHFAFLSLTRSRPSPAESRNY